MRKLVERLNHCYAVPVRCHSERPAGSEESRVIQLRFFGPAGPQNDRLNKAIFGLIIAAIAMVLGFTKKGAGKFFCLFLALLGPLTMLACVPVETEVPVVPVWFE